MIIITVILSLGYSVKSSESFSFFIFCLIIIKSRQQQVYYAPVTLISNAQIQYTNTSNFLPTVYIHLRHNSLCLHKYSLRLEFGISLCVFMCVEAQSGKSESVSDINVTLRKILCSPVPVFILKTRHLNNSPVLKQYLLGRQSPFRMSGQRKDIFQ